MNEDKDLDVGGSHMSKMKIDKDDFKLIKTEEHKVPFVKLFKIENSNELDLKYKSYIKYESEIIKLQDHDINDVKLKKNNFKQKNCDEENISTETLTICKDEKIITDIHYLYDQQKKLEIHQQCLQRNFDCSQVLDCPSSKSKKRGKKKNLKNSDDNEIFKCSQCPHQSKIRENFLKHLDMHKPKKFLKCAHCQYSTPNKFTLRKHMSTHGFKDCSRKFSCSFCGTWFQSRYYMVRHFRQSKAHNPEASYHYSCSTCGAAFRTSYELKRHVLRHSGDLHKCTVCHYATNRRYLLDKHLEQHERGENVDRKTQSRKYRENSVVAAKKNKDLKLSLKEPKERNHFHCANCDYRTSWHSILKYHILKKHTKEPVWTCSSCEYSAFHPENLRNHRRLRKHDVFCCVHCEYIGLNYIQIERHMKTHFE